ncbi:MAG: ATP phosphoribosyltransferase [Chitinophagaceae bacterium]|nr:ATP phosphoribosyltransferase [Chitinophagaceae bacterium]
MLKIAIQKSGRLHEGSLKLLKECGIDISNGNNQLRVRSSNFEAEIFFLRDDDIPEYVQDRVADAGIVGENIVYETQKKVTVVEKLGFAKCRLSLAVPRYEQYKDITDLQGKRIATSYPNILEKFLKEKGVQAAIHTISGSVEIAPRIGLADAICDLVSSGSTLFLNELREVQTILHSEAVLITHPQLNEEKLAVLESLLFRIRAVNKAKDNKYVLLNAPNHCLPQIIKLLPGMRSPTVVPLAEPGWSSVHSVISENDFWKVIEQLKANGAEGILILPIEKMIL